MKKFMKNCAIIAGIMFVVGLGMTMVAGAVKGPALAAGLLNSVPWDGLGESLGNLGGDIASGLSDLDSGVRFEVSDDFDFDDEADVLRGNTEQSFSADEVSGLDVAVGACEFFIEESEDEDFHIIVKNAGGYQGYVEDDVLHVKAMHETTIGKGKAGCTVRLYVPAGFTFDEAKLSLGAGRIKGAQELRAEKLGIELGAGEMILSALNAAELEAKVGMGALDITGDVTQKADLECAMGSIQMNLAGETTDFNYGLEVAAGAVKVGDQSYGAMAGDKKIDNHADKHIKAECAMGSIYIRFDSDAVSQSSLHHPESHEPETHHPEAYEPETHHLEAYEPEIHHSEVYEPETHHSEVYEPETHHSEVYEPETHHSEVYEPETHHPEPDQPKTHHQETHHS